MTIEEVSEPLLCAPGFVLMPKELLEQEPHPTDDHSRHYLSGDLCCCASYPEIVNAVKMATDTASPSSRR